ncbi:MAG: hypothetical protein ABW208_02210 [Pyrinomonadaceae bacterium]
MMRYGESPKTSLGRRIFMYATWVALIYSLYSIASQPDWQAWLPPRESSRGVSSTPSPARPNESQLAGLWVPDEETEARLKGLSAKLSGGSNVPQLSLTKTSFEARDIPYLSQESAPRVLFASWSGSWNLYRQQDMWAIYLPGGSLDVRVFLHEEKARYRLRVIAGDPSMNESLWFVKKQ